MPHREGNQIAARSTATIRWISTGAAGLLNELFSFNGTVVDTNTVQLSRKLLQAYVDSNKKPSLNHIVKVIHRAAKYKTFLKLFFFLSVETITATTTSNASGAASATAS